MEKFQSRSSALCTSVTADNVGEAMDQISQAERSGADIIELRLDMIRNLEDNPSNILQQLSEKCTKPYIATCRPVWEG